MIYDKRTEETTDVWLTPPYVIRALGEFDLDPCSPVDRPWATAKHHYTMRENGLQQTWHGRVWMNPPYGKASPAWFKKLAEHGNGIALIFARTDTQWFFDHVWNKASAIMFLRGRLNFFKVDGSKGATAPAATVLIAYGAENELALIESGLDGYVVSLNKGTPSFYCKVLPLFESVA